MNKIIHYCWFGPKKKPRKLKKYIKTWKKFLPDYEIKEWNEDNFDPNVTNFSKEAYKYKKWAFVSDVARVYALKEEGGIYFDTDVEIINNVKFLLDNDFWIGKEDSKCLGTATMGAKEPNNPHINKIFEVYKNSIFNSNDLYKVTSPNIFTEYFKSKGLKEGNENQVLCKDVYIYSREYFYPKTYDGRDQLFTNNTCMIHQFDASWTPIDEKVAIFFVRRKMGFMAKHVFKFFGFLRKVKHKIIKSKNLKNNDKQK